MSVFDSGASRSWFVEVMGKGKTQVSKFLGC